MIGRGAVAALCSRAYVAPWAPVSVVHRWAADNVNLSGSDMASAVDQGSGADPLATFGGNLPIEPLGSLAADSWKFTATQLLLADPSPADVLSTGFYIAGVYKQPTLTSGNTTSNIIRADETIAFGPEQVSINLTGPSGSPATGIRFRRVTAGTGDVNGAFASTGVFDFLAVGSNAGGWLFVNGALVGSSGTAVVIPACLRWRAGGQGGDGAAFSWGAEFWIGNDLPGLPEAQSWHAYRLAKYGV